MNLYIQDSGVYGMIIVAASDEPEAREKMESFSNYSEDDYVEEFEFTSDFVYANYGDL
jgi:hypothetical protein